MYPGAEDDAMGVADAWLGSPSQHSQPENTLLSLGNIESNRSRCTEVAVASNVALLSTVICQDSDAPKLHPKF